VSVVEDRLWRAVKAARHVQRHLDRREHTLAPLRSHVAATIAGLGHQVAAGTLDAGAMAAQGQKALQQAYAEAYSAGSEHASGDVGGDGSDDWDDESAARALDQHHYLLDFAAAIMAGVGLAGTVSTGGMAHNADAGTGLSDAQIDARADIYGESVTPAYEQGYVSTVADNATGPVTFRWTAVGDDSTCDTCDTLDGSEFDTMDDIPFWPGDGDFGADGDSCFVGDTIVQAPSVEIAFRRWYEGPVVHLTTGDGRSVTCTPNHPVLTDKGWVRADLLKVGDRVVGARLCDGVGLGDPDVQQGPARIDEISAPLAVPDLREWVPSARLNLNCEHPPDGDVDVVGADGPLEFDIQSGLTQPIAELELVGTDGRAGLVAEPSHGRGPTSDISSGHTTNPGPSRSGEGVSVEEFLVGLLGATECSGVGAVSPTRWLGHRLALSKGPTCVEESLALRGGAENTHGPHSVLDNATAQSEGRSDLVGRLPGQVSTANVGQQGALDSLPLGDLGTDGQSDGVPDGADLNGPSQKPCAHGRPADFQVLSDLLLRGAAQVALDDVIDVQVQPGFAGHVFNLRSNTGFYLANGVVVHNCDGGPRCRCRIDAVDAEGNVLDSSAQPTGARANVLGPATADEAAAQGAQPEEPDELDTGDFGDGATKAAKAYVTKADALHALAKAGDALPLIAWYNAGADGQIDWGSPGDFDACVAIAGEHLDDPEGFCNLRHTDATGGPPGTEDKNFSAGGTPGVGGGPPVAFAPFDLEQGVRRVYPAPGKVKKPKRSKRTVQTERAVDVGKGAPDLPAAAVPTTVIAAGLAVRAEDTGRVLMLQRAFDDPDSADRPDPAAGTWEFPGGHLDDGETPFAGAMREFVEETGVTLPDTARVVNTWTSGIYQCFVVSIPHEADLAINQRFANAVKASEGRSQGTSRTVKWGDSWQTQERADNGQFGSGSGTTPSTGGGPHPTGSGEPPRAGMGDVPITEKNLADLRASTAGPYLTPDGHFTPERQAVHDQIVTGALAGTTPVDNPRLVMMGGGPASGKSAMVGSGAVNLPDNAVHNDPDAIKAQLPEVKEMQAAGNRQWASLSHEESSYISARITAAAYEGQRNMVLDTTGDSSVDKLGGKIDAAHAAGYSVEGNYITVDPKAAVPRAMDRADATGREVPENVIRDTYSGISAVFPQAVDKFDSVRLFDNNGPKGSAPTLVASSTGPGTFTVHDPAAYGQFLSYA
jgi:8-oxo-dGTP pyrophosphatase MutT (NUDIX family)/predicted ABC-type ATPase